LISKHAKLNFSGRIICQKCSERYFQRGWNHLGERGLAWEELFKEEFFKGKEIFDGEGTEFPGII
jgi:hypothetical protein